jgi:hypothetical protein
MSDPFDLLRGHLRGQADGVEPGTSTDELISHITLEYHRGPVFSAAPSSRRKRRWGAMAVSAAVFVGLGAGAAVTATVLDRQPVSEPLAGVVCRAEASTTSSAIVLPAGPDPIGDCAQRWAAGELPLVDEQSEPTNPSLVACVGRGGALEVYPGDSDELCATLGLAAADLDSFVADPTIPLNDRIAEEINMQCMEPEQAAQAAVALLDQMGFRDWNVVLEATEKCALVVFAEGGEHTLYVRHYPPS